MVVTFNIRIQDFEVRKLLKDFGPKAIRNINKANLEFAQLAAGSIANQFRMQQKNAPRGKTATRIVARKLGKNEVGILMPMSAYWLDVNSGHWAPIKKNAKVRSWIRKNFKEGYKKSGRSRIYGLGRNQIRRGSKLYVVGDPFFAKGFNRVRRRHSVLLRKALQKTIKGG